MDELEIIQYQHVDGLSVFVNTVRYRSPHFHQDWELLWVLDAPLSVTCKQVTTLLHPGEVALFSPNLVHELRQTGKTCTFLCLQIASGPLTGNIVMDHIHLAPYLSKEDYRTVHELMLDIAKAYFYQDDFYELYCRGKSELLLHLLVSRLPCRRMTEEETMNIGRKNGRLLRLVEFVQQNYMHKLRLADFARQEGCSVSYLSHFIKESMNQTFQEYVASVRFNNACKMIGSGEQSMVAVSRAAGFSDYRYFSKAFQDAYGMTPAEYTRQSQQVVTGDDFSGHSPHSEEHLMTRGQSLYVLKRFEENLREF